jgi:putative transposase
MRFVRPPDNVLVEAFNSRFRQECLNQHWFLSLDDAQQKIEAWREEHNTQRPHSALDHRSPAEFAEDANTPETAVA